MGALFMFAFVGFVGMIVEATLASKGWGVGAIVKRLRGGK